MSVAPASQPQPQVVSARLVKRRLREALPTISGLRAALELLERGLSAPSPEELRQFNRGLIGIAWVLPAADFVWVQPTGEDR